MSEKIPTFIVTDRSTFIKFLELLRKDLSNNFDSWENQNLNNFLEAMTIYTEDIQDYYDNIGQDINADEPSWRVFADIFKGARIYE